MTKETSRSSPVTRDDVAPLSDLSSDDAVAWAMVEACPDALVVVDESGTIELVNRQTEVGFGYDRGELLGHRVEVLIPERFGQIHTAHRTRYRAAPDVRSMGTGMELLARRSDGTEFPVEVSLSPLRVDGRLRIIAAVRDITDRVAAEALDREIRRGLDLVEDGVFMFDVDALRFHYVNSGAVEQVGYGRTELLTMTPLHIAPEFTEASFRELLAPLVADEVRSAHFTTVHRHLDGTDIPVEVVLQSPSPGTADRPRSCVALVRDIRDRLARDAELERTRRWTALLEDRERIARELHDSVIGRLFGTGMAIEATMSGLHDDVLRRRLGSAVAQIDDTIKEIRVAVYGRQQATPLERTRDIIVRIAADQAGSLGFEPTIELSGPIDDLDQLVTDHLVATVREALTNAAKYAAAQRLGVSVHVDERLVQLRVVDDGIGFSVDAAASELRDDDGGHGLDNIETRAQSLGGTMTITSEPGGGTVIDWTVPRPSR